MPEEQRFITISPELRFDDGLLTNDGYWHLVLRWDGEVETDQGRAENMLDAKLRRFEDVTRVIHKHMGFKHVTIEFCPHDYDDPDRL